MRVYQIVTFVAMVVAVLFAVEFLLFLERRHFFARTACLIGVGSFLVIPLPLMLRIGVGTLVVLTTVLVILVLFFIVRVGVITAFSTLILLGR